MISNIIIYLILNFIDIIDLLFTIIQTFIIIDLIIEINLTINLKKIIFFILNFIYDHLSFIVKKLYYFI